MRWRNPKAQHFQRLPFFVAIRHLRIAANLQRLPIRLYQPPVESDIQSKPATAADRSARSRSTIRRVLDRNEDRVRERRRRVLAAAAAYNSFDANRRGLATVDATSIPPATTDADGVRSGSEHGRRALHEASRRAGILDDRVVAMFGERWAHLHAESNPSPLRDTDNDPSPILTMAVDPEFLSRRNQLRPEPTYALSSIRSTQAANHPVSLRRPLPELYAGSNNTQSRSATRSPGSLWSHVRRQRNSMRDERNRRIRAEFIGGLGDRDRSLSPEGDNVWDTLLSTLTPDPQPPSLGSSFASASASAAATQSTAAASSRTSFTTPDAADESIFEPPCESGCDNSDTEGEDEEDAMDQLQTYIPGLRPRRRSYADVARGNNEDPLELLGGIGGMQRIVRNLARREDIPDEWWADAGLSRTLSRETSGN